MWRVFLFSLVIIYSCKSTSELAKKKYPNCNFGDYTKAQIEQYTDSLALDFKWLKIKSKVDATFEDKTYNFQVKLRIRKDSIVFAKISKAGFTAFRIAITKDSVVFVDKLKNQYFRGKIEDLEKIANMNLPFEVIQNLLLGEPTFLYKNEGYSLVKEPYISLSSQPFVVNEQKQDTNLHQSQTFSCDSLRLKSVGVFDGKSGKKVLVSYSDFGDINGYLLNKKIEVKALKDDKPLILAEMELKRIKTYDDLTAPIDIPDDYKRIKIK